MSSSVVQANIVLDDILLNSTHVASDGYTYGGANYVWYDKPANSWTSITNTLYAAQTFQPSVAFTTTSAKVRLKKTGTPSGTVYLELWSTSSNLPSALIVSSNKSFSVLSGTATWETFDYSDTALTAGTKYAIVLYTNTVPISEVEWSQESTSPIYNLGRKCDSSNGGSTWTGYDGIDMCFAVLPDYLSGIKMLTTAIEEEGGTKTIEHNIVNRTGNLIQRLGSPPRKWTIRGFVEGASANIATIKTLFNTKRNSTSSFNLHIEQINSPTSAYFVQDLNVFVDEVRWTGIESGFLYDRWTYEIRLREDTT